MFMTLLGSIRGRQIVDYEFPAWGNKEVIKGFSYVLIKYYINFSEHI